ncbi:hypothetical protein PENTCL1PPCAC_14828, partial [Pristionchus entomophagus]
VALGTFETLYEVQTFRRFSHAVSPYASSALSLLSAVGSFLTLRVCNECRRVNDVLKRRTMHHSVRRQLRIYDVILMLSLVVSLATFIAMYAPVVWRCASIDLSSLFQSHNQRFTSLKIVVQFFFVATEVAAPCALLALTYAHFAR